MNEISTSEMRKDISNAVNRVIYGKERIMINRHGKNVAALIPLEDLAYLKQMEEEEDLQAAREAMSEEGESIPWEYVKEELGLAK